MANEKRYQLVEENEHGEDVVLESHERLEDAEHRLAKLCDGDADVYLVDRLEELRALNDALWETLIKVGDALDIDYDEARKANGKPSDVFIAHIKSMETTINRLEAQVEHLGEISGND